MATGCLPAVWPLAVRAQPRDPRRPPRVGVEPSFLAAGLPSHLNRRMAADIGIAMELVPRPSLVALAQLDANELDMVITNTPEQEAALVDAGLAHDRRFLARTRFVIAGPVVRGSDPAGLRKPNGAVADDALQALRDIAATAGLGRARFVAPAADTGALVREQALWRSLGVNPATDFTRGAHAGWYTPAAGNGSATDTLTAAATQSAYTLVDRPTFVRAKPAGLASLVLDELRLDCSYHIMQGFRHRHPAARLVLNWLTGPNGRRALSGFAVAGERYLATPLVRPQARIRASQTTLA